MATTLTLSKVAVRRFLLDQQALHGRAKSSKPDDVLQLIQHLGCVQMDPVAAVERNQHLVLAARLHRYKPTTLERLIGQGRVFEYWANAMCTIPMEDYPLLEGTRRRRSAQLQLELDKLGPVVDHVLKRLEAEGPLPSKAFESGNRVHGYWDNTQAQAKTKDTSHALNLLNDIGQILVVRREGTTRYFDIRDRAVPKGVLDAANQINVADADTALLEKYMRAYRVFDLGDSRFGWQRMKADERRQTVHQYVKNGKVVPIHIEGVKRPYFILAEDVEALEQHQRLTRDKSSAYSNAIRFLAPLDNLLWRRERIEDLFDFSYTWEVYTPQSKRTYGYYAMPILAGDTLIGRLDPRLNRHEGKLDIQLFQIEPQVRWTKTLRTRLLRALDDFAHFHQAELGDIARTLPEGLMLHN